MSKKKSKLDFVKEGKHYNVMFDKVKIGYIYCEVDGCFVFVDIRDGFWTSWWMKQIVEKLDKLNEKWDQMVNNMSSNGKAK